MMIWSKTEKIIKKALWLGAMIERNTNQPDLVKIHFIANKTPGGYSFSLEKTKETWNHIAFRSCLSLDSEFWAQNVEDRDPRTIKTGI